MTDVHGQKSVDGRSWMEIKSQRMDRSRRTDESTTATTLQSARKFYNDGGVALQLATLQQWHATSGATTMVGSEQRCNDDEW